MSAVANLLKFSAVSLLHAANHAASLFTASLCTANLFTANLYTANHVLW